jgi:Fe-S-cluster-containing hydrogenase component 2
MKKLAVQDQNACMACLTCEVVCAQAFYKNENTQTQNLSCIRITGAVDKIKIVSCVQCGKCAKACESKAITKNANDVYVLNKKDCVDCGKCVEACPFGVMVKARGKTNPTKCIACGICVKACPQNVLYIKEGPSKEAKEAAAAAG